MNTCELVLGVPVSDFDRTFGPNGVGFLDCARYAAEIDGFFRSSRMNFRPRGECETDFSWLQLIPYVVAVAPDGCLLCYRRGRAGSEDRLHDLLSIGVGGHVNPVDFEVARLGFRLGFYADPLTYQGSVLESVKSAAARELFEELGVTASTAPPPNPDLALHGLIRCRDSNVDRVHLGVVFLAHVDTRDPFVFAPEIAEPQWVHPHLIPDTWPMERWSRVLIDSGRLAL